MWTLEFGVHNPYVTVSVAPGNLRFPGMEMLSSEM